MRLRIKEKITGHVGIVYFESGVSTGKVSAREANLLRAIMGGTVVLQDDGVTVDEALNKLDEILPREFYESNKIPVPSPYLPYLDGTYPVTAAVTTPAPAAAQASPVPAQKSKYTRGELEEIADAKGIAGLRELAAPLGIKSNSIAGLIDALLGITPSESAGDQTKPQVKQLTSAEIWQENLERERKV